MILDLVTLIIIMNIIVYKNGVDQCYDGEHINTSVMWWTSDSGFKIQYIIHVSQLLYNF